MSGQRYSPIFATRQEPDTDDVTTRCALTRKQNGSKPPVAQATGVSLVTPQFLGSAKP